MIKRLLVLMIVLTALTPAQQGFRPETSETPDTFRPEIHGTHGIVATGRFYSVHAGMRILEEGGNAVDAGVAAVFASSVVEISHFGFGGEVPLLIYNAKTGKVISISGQGTAPRGLKPEYFQKMTLEQRKNAHFKNSAGVELPVDDIGLGRVPTNGPLAATLPAVMDSLTLALENYGTMSLQQVMAPAIELADGFPFVEMLHHYWVANRKVCEKYPDTMATYYPGGKTPEVGEMFRQPHLAKTLRAIVAAEQAEFRRSHNRRKAIEAGRNAFYRGDIARRIAAADEKAGGVITYEDLANYHGRIEEPTTTNYRGYQVYKEGFWDQGPALLETLNILEGFNLAKMGLDSADYIHTVTEAMKLAYDDRDTYFGDPLFAKVPMRGLLSKAYAAERRKLIDPNHAAVAHRPGDPWKFENGPEAMMRVLHSEASTSGRSYFPHVEGTPTPGYVSGDTTCVNAVDKDGNLFSATPSSGWILGGAFIAGDTGVPLSNRTQVFSVDPKSPNVVAPGKRPRTTLTPTIVLRSATGAKGERFKPFLAISTPGGDSQDQQILNVLLAVIDFKLPLQVAIEGPRFNTDNMFSSFDGHQDNLGELTVESRVGPEVIAALRAKGHKLTVIGPYDMATGVTAVGVDPKFGTLIGGADMRRDRYIMGW